MIIGIINVSLMAEQLHWTAFNCAGVPNKCMCSVYYLLTAARRMMCNYSCVKSFEGVKLLTLYNCLPGAAGGPRSTK